MVRVLSADAIAESDPVLCALLDDDERQRSRAFRMAADRRSYIGAHALLRSLLSDAMPGRAPHQWRFSAGPRGKPLLAAGDAPRDLRFNLSHCRGKVAVAIAERAEVGIDIESLARMDFDERGIAEANFCAAERECVAGIDDALQRKRTFLAIWTAKEALIKALGEGLSLPLDSFCVDLAGIRYDAYAAEVREAAWQLAHWDLPGHPMSLATPPGLAVDCREVRWDAAAGAFVDAGELKPLAPGGFP